MGKVMATLWAEWGSLRVPGLLPLTASARRRTPLTSASWGARFPALFPDSLSLLHLSLWPCDEEML